MHIIFINDQPMMRLAQSLLLRDILGASISIQEESSTQDFIKNQTGKATGNATGKATGNTGDLIIFGLNEATASVAQSLQHLVDCCHHTPVLVLSGCAHPTAAALAYKCGAQGCVLSSSQPSALKHIISLVCSGESFFPAITQDTIIHESALKDTLNPPQTGQNGKVQKSSKKSYALMEEQGDIVPLTARQIDVLKLLAQGQANKHIARSLGIFEGTVKAHLRMIAQKMGTHNRTELALLTARLNIFDQDAFAPKSGAASPTAQDGKNVKEDRLARGKGKLRAVNG